jgi:hypothetical protein
MLSSLMLKLSLFFEVLLYMMKGILSLFFSSSSKLDLEDGLDDIEDKISLTKRSIFIRFNQQ